MAKRYYPEKFNLVTDVDEAALIMDIDRISGESLENYKKRVLESSSKISNSSYSGLVNAINRELGLTQKEIIKVSFKNVFCGNLSNSDISYSDFTITDNRLYTGTINGTSVKVISNVIEFSSELWQTNELVGLTFFVNENKYRIISNTNKTISFQESFDSLLLNKEYEIKADWIVSELLNYVLVLENERYPIVENSSNKITLSKRIKYKTNGFYSLQLNRPKIEVTSSRIIFYLDYLNRNNFRTEIEVDLREGDISHADLCKRINKESRHYYLEDLIPLESPVKAFTIKQKESDVKVFQENIPASKFFKLANKNIKPESLKFSEQEIFSLEEEEIPEELNGPYYSVSHLEGVLKAKNLPSGFGKISYTYMDFPFILESSPAVITNLSDSESQKFLFSQKEKLIYENSRDRFMPSQPKAEMIEYISELLKINKQSWGE